MESKDFLHLLKRYEADLKSILSRFSVEGKHIAGGDESRLRTIVSELDDLLTDHLGKNKYSDSIVKSFNLGIRNYYNAPSYNCVENIISAISPAITRIERNPEMLNKKEIKEIQNKPLEYPEKMTLSWLWIHVPLPYVWSFIGFLFFTSTFFFSLGVAFSSTSLYKSLTDIATAKTKETINTKAKSEKKKNLITPIVLTPKS